MTNVTPPPDVVKATLIDLDTGTETVLVPKDGSYCHFVPDNQRQKWGAHEIRFRLDWADRNPSDDPTLDADLFDACGIQLTKPQRSKLIGGSHHTERSWDASAQVRAYRFQVSGLSLTFVVRMERIATQTGTARIKEADGVIPLGKRWSGPFPPDAAATDSSEARQGHLRARCPAGKWAA